MPVRPEREYRIITTPFEARKIDEDDTRYIVEGYATTFDDPYVLWEDMDGTKYYETIDRNAFAETDMSDVIMQYDHAGMVYARNKNGTLQLEADERGLKVIADLSSTNGSRELYDAINKGLIDQMSFAFVVAKDGDTWDEKTRTRTITNIRKLYDVSAVSIPANPDTVISARAFIEGVLEKEREERARAEAIEKQKQKIRILTEVF